MIASRQTNIFTPEYLYEAVQADNLPVVKFMLDSGCPAEIKAGPVQAPDGVPPILPPPPTLFLPGTPTSLAGPLRLMIRSGRRPSAKKRPCFWQAKPTSCAADVKILGANELLRFRFPAGRVTLLEVGELRNRP